MALHVRIEEYDPRWVQAFEEEKKALQAILKNNSLDIHHIGSTSVPGLAAKPIIDIMPVVRSLEKVDKVAKAFEDIGYEYLGEFGIPGRRYLRKGGDERTHNVHIFAETDKRNISRHLGFRDYLRQHPEAREAYVALKRKLALQFPYDVMAYNDGKDRFIKKIEARVCGGECK